jgi:hypothetical protein
MIANWRQVLALCGFSDASGQVLYNRENQWMEAAPNATRQFVPSSKLLLVTSNVGVVNRRLS